MSRNIKEIGKELMGKSLNSFHRKTGLTQLEKNNEMQDGILDGILSQVDDAYIEKTEQSNVIHLEGSGDGAVVLDGIEGNTMVNIASNYFNNSIYTRNSDKSINIRQHDTSLHGHPTLNKLDNLKRNTTYTLFTSTSLRIIIRDNPINGESYIPLFDDVSNKATFTTNSDTNLYTYIKLLHPTSDKDYPINNIKVILVEGDYSNKEINHFEGLQSSFEEKVNGQGKYEIEILSNNRNLLKLYDTKDTLSVHGLTIKMLNRNEILINGTSNSTHTWVELLYDFKQGTNPKKEKVISLNKNVKYTLSSNVISGTVSNLNSISFTIQYQNGEVNTSCKGSNNFKTTFNNSDGAYRLWFYVSQDVTFNNCVISLQLEKGEVKTSYIANKQNKIKLLLDEPLRAIDDIKDRLCIKDGKLVVERKIKQVTYNGSENWVYQDATTSSNNYLIVSDIDVNSKLKVDKVPYLINVVTNTNHSIEGIGVKRVPNRVELVLNVLKSKLPSLNSNGIKNWISQNNLTVCYQLAEPRYEEVLNEYGEPIMLEGYENGTLYIDSTIVPTTTVRYTPKMESFKTLEEVNNNNIMLTNDVNDNIIPYMMDVDLMIMEKEMALMSQYKIRRIGAKDMTSMQKRTQDMLTRLIKGKTLTEQECKTRVVTYLDAGKITDAQADELMLLISEVYA